MMQNYENQHIPHGDLSCQLPEPEPDYQTDDSEDFPPPPSPRTLQQSMPAVNNSEDNNNNNNNNNSNNNNSNSNNNSHHDNKNTSAETASGYEADGAGAAPDEGGERSHSRRVLPPGAVSKEREAMHRELLMNCKTGRDVLQRGELSKVLAERKATQKRKEWQQQQAAKRTSLELKLEKRAHQLQQDQEERMQEIQEDAVTSELLQIHRRITHKGQTPSPT